MEPGETYVTQADVARHAGVHQTTVSLVFRNHPSIAAATRERVLAAARELGYKRHPLLAALMTTRLRLGAGAITSTLAFLTDFARRDRWRESPTAVEMYEGARRRSQELGYGLDIFWLADPAMPPGRLAGIFEARNIHGLLLAPTAEPHGLLTFDFAPFSVVGLGVSNETSSLLSVSHDHFNGMRTALQHCIAAGRKRVGVVLTVEANEIVHDKWLAAYALLTGPARPLVPLPPWRAPFSAAGLREWVAMHRPDALVGTFDDRLRALLQEEGYRVPKDIALASVCLPRGDHYHAGVYERSTTIGERAVDLVVSALNHNQSGLLPMRQTLQIEGEWRTGPSMPPGA